MSEIDSISIPDEDFGDWRVMKDACINMGVNFSKLVFEGTKKEFVNGGWAKLVKQRKQK